MKNNFYTFNVHYYNIITDEEMDSTILAPDFATAQAWAEDEAGEGWEVVELWG